MHTPYCLTNVSQAWNLPKGGSQTAIEYTGQGVELEFEAQRGERLWFTAVFPAPNVFPFVQLIFTFWDTSQSTIGVPGFQCPPMFSLTMPDNLASIKVSGNGTDLYTILVHRDVTVPQTKPSFVPAVLTGCEGQR